MAVLTQPRNGAALYHDVDTDRSALHQRYDDWCNDPDTRELLRNMGRKNAINVDSFTFTGVPGVEGGEVHTIVVTYVLETDEQRDKAEKAEQLERRNRELYGALVRARDGLEAVL